MLRKTLNASRLQEEVHRRLHRLQEVLEDGVKIGVPRPQSQAPDRTGSNWTMQHFGNAAGFEASIARVLAQVQAEYNLAQAPDEAEPPQPQPDAAQEAGDPFGGTTRAAARNPFGEAKAAPAANPFGDSTPKGKSNPFDDAKPGDDNAQPQRGKRGPNPFGDD